MVYHGAAEWGVPLSFAEAVDLDDETLRPYVLDFHYSLTDLRRIDDAKLSRQKELRIGLLLLKHGGRGGDLRQILVEVGRAAAALSTDDLVTLVRYIISEPNEVEAAMLRDLLRRSYPVRRRGSCRSRRNSGKPRVWPRALLGVGLKAKRKAKRKAKPKS